MNYEVVTLEPVTIAGIVTRTGNEAPDMMEKLQKLWMDYMGPDGACERMPHKAGEKCYGLYYNYTWDDMQYDALAGWGVEPDADMPAEYAKVSIPGGKFAKFVFHGDATQNTSSFWGEVWATELPRAYSYDFEVYLCDPGKEEDATIEIYVALADVCQSCGMPMTADEHYGTNADGSKNTEYCCYCYKDGAFTASCTVEEMVEICLNACPEMYTDREKSRKMMLEFFPTLKRWRK